MTGKELTLAEEKRQVARALEHFEAGQLQLRGVLQSLPEPSPVEPREEDVNDEWDDLTELRNTIACVLEDYVKPTLQDLQSLLAGKGEEGEGP